MHEKAAKIGKGDLVRITGRVRQASYEANGERQYTVDLIVERMSALVKAGGAPADREDDDQDDNVPFRSEEHTSELQSLMRISYAVFCLKKKTKYYKTDTPLIIIT